MAKERVSQTELETDDFHNRVNEAMEGGDDPATTISKKKTKANMLKQYSQEPEPEKKLMKMTRRVSIKYNDPKAEKLNKRMESVDDKEKAYQERMKKQGKQINPPVKEKITVKKTTPPKTNMNPKTVLGIDLKKGIIGKK